jgi:cyclopropane fatty-acyl-phospholipid synthase-like methyltransferase
MDNQSTENSLITSMYWGERQKNQVLKHGNITSDYEWLDVIEPYLKKYEYQRFLELGCSPGHVSAAICSRIALNPEGVDYSPESDLYLKNMESVGFPNAKLHKCNLFSLHVTKIFDVVGSFGLVEHFSDIKQVLYHHDRLLRKDGLCIIVIPNFRKVQYLYHYIFDRTDLNNHNINSMNLKIFEEFAQEASHKILFLGYSGKLKFWNFDSTGNRFTNFLRKNISRVVRRCGSTIGEVLPSGHPYLAPWIVYVGEKKID